MDRDMAWGTVPRGATVPPLVYRFV